MVDSATRVGRYRLTTRLLKVGVAMSIGSLSAFSPGAIVTVGRPANLRARSVPAWTLVPPPCKPRCTGQIVSASAPYKLDKRIRIFDPPMLVRTTCRMVCAASAGPAESGTALQEAFQRSLSWPYAEVLRIKLTKRALGECLMRSRVERLAGDCACVRRIDQFYADQRAPYSPNIAMR